MTNLTGQRRLAAQILKIGQNRVWINPEFMDDVEGAITREEVRKLIHEKIIVSLPEKGVSRSRAKTIRGKKRLGRRSGGLCQRDGSHQPGHQADQEDNQRYSSDHFFHYCLSFHAIPLAKDSGLQRR